MYDLKAQTKCYNCHEMGYWSADYTKPRKKRLHSKDPRNVDGGMKDANMAESLSTSNALDNDSHFGSDNNYAFVVNTYLYSYYMLLNP